MKILISGGTGLVGKELGKALVAKGHELFVLSRSEEKSIATCPYPHTAIYWDAMRGSVPEKIMETMDGVINLAGVNISEQRWSENFKNKLFNSRVIGTQNLVRDVNEYGKNVQFFISTSAIGYYGDKGSESLLENAPPGQTFFGKLCSAWESPVDNFLEDRVRSVIYRVGVVFSEKGGALAQMVPPIQMGLGGNLGSGNQIMSWIDIDDLVNLYVYAVENEIKGTYNAVAPNPVSNKLITSYLGNFFGKKTPFTAPKFALRMFLGELSNSIFESQNLSSEKIQGEGFKYEHETYDSSLKKRVPKLAPTERRLIYEQWVPKTKETIFPFFSEAKNLETITPPWLNFNILKAPDKIQEGSQLEYKISLGGIPMKWVTKIEKFDSPNCFIDNQLKGPYKKWHHTHSFEDFAGGTILRDVVDSIVPIGLLGRGMVGWKVYGDVEQIFLYRRKIIAQTFFEKPTKSPETE